MVPTGSESSLRALCLVWADGTSADSRNDTLVGAWRNRGRHAPLAASLAMGLPGLCMGGLDGTERSGPTRVGRPIETGNQGEAGTTTTNRRQNQGFHECMSGAGRGSRDSHAWERPAALRRARGEDLSEASEGTQQTSHASRAAPFRSSLSSLLSADCGPGVDRLTRDQRRPGRSAGVRKRRPGCLPRSNESPVSIPESARPAERERSATLRGDR